MASLFQFSIRSLLVGVTIVALGIAALLNANGWWATAIWSPALVTLATGVLLIIYRRNEIRAFWIGYTVFGGLFVILLVCSLSIDVLDVNLLNTRPLYYALPTTKLTQLFYDSALPESRRLAQIAAPPQVGEASAPPRAGNLNAYSVDELVVPSGQGARYPIAASGVSGSPIASNVTDGTIAYSLSGSSGPISLSYGIAGNISSVPATVANPKYIPPGNFVSIGQALWLLLIAAGGGKVCQLIYRTRPTT